MKAIQLHKEIANVNKNNDKWSREEIAELYNLPFNDLLFKAHQIHRQNFAVNEIQASALLSVKTGSCPENCSYCPQSAHYNTGIKKEEFMDIADIKEKAIKAKEAGATRFCVGAAWRSLHDRDVAKTCDMIKAVKETGLESCVTLGMITAWQAQKLKEAGLDYYNHNIDTSEEYYKKIITTRTYQDRLDTLENIANADIKICCGGIIGMGEERNDRIGMMLTIANHDPQPESIPINKLVKVEGTPLQDCTNIDDIEFVKTIAIARILAPKSYVRLSAGRTEMSESTQALCFFAGANSIFYGEKLLTTDNPAENEDKKLLDKLGIKLRSN